MKILKIALIALCFSQAAFGQSYSATDNVTTKCRDCLANHPLIEDWIYEASCNVEIITNPVLRGQIWIDWQAQVVKTDGETYKFTYKSYADRPTQVLYFNNQILVMIYEYDKKLKRSRFKGFTIN